MRATNRQARFSEGRTKEAKSGDAVDTSPPWPAQCTPSCSGAPMNSPAAPKTHPKRPNWRQSSMQFRHTRRSVCHAGKVPGGKG